MALGGPVKKGEPRGRHVFAFDSAMAAAAAIILVHSSVDHPIGWVTDGGHTSYWVRHVSFHGAGSSPDPPAAG